MNLKWGHMRSSSGDSCNESLAIVWRKSVVFTILLQAVHRHFSVLRLIVLIFFYLEFSHAHFHAHFAFSVNLVILLCARGDVYQFTYFCFRNLRASIKFLKRKFFFLDSANLAQILLHGNRILTTTHCNPLFIA